MRVYLLYVLFLVALINQVYGQNGQLSITNKKAITLYQRAIASYDSYDQTAAIDFLLQSLNKEERFVEAYLLLSQIYLERRDFDKAIDAAENAISINPDYFPNIHFNLGNMYLAKGEYQKALDKFIHFQSYRTIRSDNTDINNRKIQLCEFALNSIKNPVDFIPENLGDNINSVYDDYWPSLSADENTLVITVNIPRDSTSEIVLHNRQEDFFITHRDFVGNWQKIRPIGYPINSPQNEGAQTITADGKTMYYTMCKNVCSIYRSKLLKSGNWDRPVKLPKGINHDRYSSKQPSISPDGRTLYFVSNRNGGLGNYDVWRSSLADDGNWSNPVNVGDQINTPYMEQSPFIHFDNKTLYFSSDGRIGMGGLDIFVSRLLDDSTWSEPKNLGYPINTFGDEDGLIVNAKGVTAYYSSDRGKRTKRDIYTFKLNPDVQPIPASYISGEIYDIETHYPVKANFSLFNLKTGFETMKSIPEDDGSYIVCIPTDESYAFFASARGYLFYSDHFDIKGQHSFDKPYQKDIGLTPIKVDGLIIMKNIFFETDSYELKDESKVELNHLLELLINNPTLKIEVSGHTDEVGSDDYNQKLSEERAKSVVDYLVENNIHKERLSWKGYGETKPISNNKSDDGRSENRRTEVKVVGV